MHKTRLALCASALVITAAGSAEAGTLWVGRMTAANEVPPNTQTATGTTFLILNDAETTGTVTSTHNVAPPLTGGHIHRAPAGVNGPIIFPFPNPASPVGPLTWAMTPADVASLKAEGLYVNIHNALLPGGVIRDQLRRALLAPSASGGAQTAAANALDVSAGYASDLDQVLMAAAIAAPAARAQIVQQLSGETVYSQGRQATEAMVDAQQELFSHAEDLGTGDGAGLFGRISRSWGKRDTIAGQAGAKVTRTGLTAGIDYAASGYVFGAALSYADGDDKFRGGLGSTEAKTTSVHVFAATRGEGLQFIATGGYGWVDYDTVRALSAISRTATSSHDGKVWGLAAKVQAPMIVGAGLNLAPYALVDMQRATIDRYAESGAGAVSLAVDKHKQKTAAVEAGAALVLPAGDSGWSGRLQAGWRYLIDEGDDAFAARVAGSPVAFGTPVLSAGRSAAHLSAMLSGRLGANGVISAGYRGLIAKRADVHMAQVRVSLRLN